MSKPIPAPFDKKKVVAENRRARFDYFVDDRFEAGIALDRHRGEGASARRRVDRGKLCDGRRRGSLADQQSHSGIQPRQPAESSSRGGSGSCC